MKGIFYTSSEAAAVNLSIKRLEVEDRNTAKGKVEIAIPW